MIYEYVAYTPDMTRVKGMIDAADEDQAENALEKKGYVVLGLKPATLRPSIKEQLPSIFGVKSQDVINFSRHLCTLIESGIAIMPALQIALEQARNDAFRKVVAALIKDIRAGSSFSEAMGKHPKVFTEMYTQMAKVGEQAGNLDVALSQAAIQMEKEQLLIQKAKRAMMMPAITSVAAVFVIVILFAVALPPMIDMFTNLDVELPLITRLLIAITDFIGAYKLYLLLGVVGVVILARWYTRRPRGRRKLDWLLLKAPLIGQINLSANMSRFSRTMSTLLSAGLPLVQIMNLAQQSVSNGIIRDALEHVRKGLTEGQGLYGPMARTEIFPSLLLQMVRVGEETGTLDSTFTTLADVYERQADERMSALVSTIEPVMIVGLGLVVGFIAVAVIMPMYSIMGSIG